MVHLNISDKETLVTMMTVQLDKIKERILKLSSNNSSESAVASSSSSSSSSTPSGSDSSPSSPTTTTTTTSTNTTTATTTTPLPSSEEVDRALANAFEQIQALTMAITEVENAVKLSPPPAKKKPSHAQRPISLETPKYEGRPR